MTDFFYCSLNLPNVLISIANCFFDSDFPSRVLLYQKRQFQSLWGTKPRDQKQETGNDSDVISGLQAL